MKISDERLLLAEDLRRNGQTYTAGRVEALSDIGFQRFKRDLLCRYAADGKFCA